MPPADGGDQCFLTLKEITHLGRRQLLRPCGVARVLEGRQVGLAMPVDFLLTQVAGMHVGFFSYGYRLLELTESVEGVALAGLVDIGLMKLDALVGRGSRKDFYDLYVIAQEMPLADLLSHGATKYPYARDFELMAVESMVLIENADRDVQPDLLIEAPWHKVRRFFIAQARALAEMWFEDQEV